jgi:ABC-type nitrate/sulfonate/bicarbonate transport system ATPase subunit
MKDNQLILDNVSFSYDDLAVIQNLNIKVNAGEFLVLVGPSGCGKTTLLNLLSGYFTPNSGKVKSNGIIRTVYQQDGLFPWLTASENIRMGLEGRDPDKIESELKELFELMHLKGFENSYPHELSGGMKQRVELARALAGDSDILLMDEPFSALDYQTRLRIRHELIRLLNKRPRTVIFVTHDIEEAAQLADRVIVLSNRPATVFNELTINSPKPRTLTDSSVIEAMKAILTSLNLNTPSDINVSSFDTIDNINN